MKAIRIFVAGTLLSGAALVAASLPFAVAGAAAQAADGAAAASAPEDGMGYANPGHRHGGGLAYLYSKLNLSADQQASVKSILEAARPGLQSLHQQMRANSLKLRQTTPDDPNFASIANEVGQARGTLSTQMVTQMADLRSKLYAVLTPAQKTQLAELEAKWQANGVKHWGHGPAPQAAAPATTGGV